jgi:hypothetical protein
LEYLLELLLTAFAWVYAKLRYPDEATDPPRGQMVLLLALAAVPVALSLLAVGLYLLAAR